MLAERVAALSVEIPSAIITAELTSRVLGILHDKREEKGRMG